MCRTLQASPYTSPVIGHHPSQTCLFCSLQDLLLGNRLVATCFRSSNLRCCGRQCQILKMSAIASATVWLYSIQAFPATAFFVSLEYCGYYKCWNYLHS